jgi:2-polyprenyl-3-methyl-5-hydroxy-6-metoxy-1,4-benzoquinol methylase
MKEFWDKQQEVFSRANSPSEAFKKGYFKFLANSDPGDIWRFLEIGDRIWKGIKVLNIGVGTGRDTESLHEKGVDVSVLDISPLALERVKDIANCFSPEKLEELPDNYCDDSFFFIETGKDN